MPTPQRADVHTLIAAYALDALDDDERADFESHLAECEACREEVDGFRRTAVRLADGVAVAPPPRLRERVLAEALVTPQARDVVALRARPMTPEPSRLWLAAASVLAVLTLGTGAFAWSQYQSAQTARTEAARISAVVGDPAARLVRQRLPAGGGATLVVAGSQAVLTGADLPALPDQRTYQLWIVRPGRITSAGLGPAGAAGAAQWQRVVEGVRRGDVVAVSVEPTGGSAQPTTTPLLTLQA